LPFFLKSELREQFAFLVRFSARRKRDSVAVPNRDCVGVSKASVAVFLNPTDRVAVSEDKTTIASHYPRR
jgi:hypothetical protein